MFLVKMTKKQFLQVKIVYNIDKLLLFVVLSKFNIQFLQSIVLLLLFLGAPLNDFGKMTKKTILKDCIKQILLLFVNLSRFNVQFLQSMVLLLIFLGGLTKCFRKKWRKTMRKVEHRDAHAKTLINYPS